MTKYKHKGRQAFVWFLLLINLFAPVTCLAGIETLGFTDDSKSKEKCSFTSSYSAERGNRWWSKPMQAVMDASVSVGEGVFKSVAGGAKKLMVVGGCLWLAIFTMKIVGGLVESDPLDNVTKVGGMMLRIGFAATLLANPTYFFGYFFAPVIETGAGFVNTGSLGLGSSPEIKASGGTGLRSAASAAKGMAGSIHDSVAQVKAAASYLKCLSKIHKIDVKVFEFTIWDPGAFFGGCLMWLAGWAFIAVFPFFLIDACFRMGVVAALCPLFIVAWVFQSTRSYAGKGFGALLNVAFTFMMVKISMLVALKLLVGSSGLDKVNGGFDGNEKSKTSLVCTYRSFKLGDGKDPCDSVGKLGDGNGNIFAFCVCVVYGVLLIKEGANSLASHFSGVSFSNDMAFKAALTGATSAATVANKAVSKVANTAVAGVINAQAKYADKKALATFDEGQAKLEKGLKLTPNEQLKFNRAQNRLLRRGVLNQEDLKDFRARRKTMGIGNSPTELSLFTPRSANGGAGASAPATSSAADSAKPATGAAPSAGASAKPATPAPAPSSMADKAKPAGSSSTPSSAGKGTTSSSSDFGIGMKAPANSGSGAKTPTSLADITKAGAAGAMPSDFGVGSKPPPAFGSGSVPTFSGSAGDGPIKVTLPTSSAPVVQKKGLSPSEYASTMKPSRGGGGKKRK